jgi:hypothetical protein
MTITAYRSAVASYLRTAQGSTTPKSVRTYLLRVDPCSLGMSDPPHVEQIHALRSLLEENVGKLLESAV